MVYTFSFRAPGKWFFKTLKLKGQSYNARDDRLICTLADGTYYEIPDLNRCETKYDQKMVDLIVKAQKEKQENDLRNAQGQGKQ